MFSSKKTWCLDRTMNKKGDSNKEHNALVRNANVALEIFILSKITKNVFWMIDL